MRYCTLIFLLLIGLTNLSAQESLLTLADGNTSLKKVVKTAKKEKKPILAILYSTSQPISHTNSFANIKDLIRAANYEIVVIDLIKSPRKYAKKFEGQNSNPTWLTIHPEDEVILKLNPYITTNEQLSKFLTTSTTLYKEVDQGISKYESSKKLSDLLALADISTKTEDKAYMTKTLDEYLKRIDPERISDKNYKKVMDVGSKAGPSNRLQYLILQDRDKAMRLGNPQDVLNAQQEYILSQLRSSDLLEPYYVWERYEKELGYHADSMYRRFALVYFSSIVPDKKALYDESYDYISLYPRTEWRFLDGLYEIVLTGTNKKEELEELLDLLFFQISREEGYKQLDYKAFVLYKLGQKEKALNMIQQINELAMKKGVRYKSLIYSIASP